MFVLSMLKVRSVARRSMRPHRVQSRCHCVAAVTLAFVLRAPRRSAISGHYGITVRTPPWCDKGFTVWVYLLLGIFCLHKAHVSHKVIQFSVDCRILFVFL